MNGEAFSVVDGLKIKIERLLYPSDIFYPTNLHPREMRKLLNEGLDFVEELMKSSKNNPSLNSQCREMLKLVYKQVDSFEETAKTTLNTTLDEWISSEVGELEGFVDELITSTSEGNVEFSIDEVENLKQLFQSSTLGLKMEEKRCADGLYNLVPEDEEEEEEVPSRMIGLSDVYEKLKRRLFVSQVTALVGMPGIGKTALANKFFHDPCYSYDRRVWVQVGKGCLVKDIPRRILAEMDPDSLEALPQGDEEAVHECLKAILMNMSCLIVLDDVWDRFAMYLLSPQYRYKWNELNHPFIPRWSVNRILLTSRFQQLDECRTGSNILSDTVTMRLLNKEESWDLLRDKVFCKGSSCPPQLEKAGKEISENCDGLPLTILAVARRLSEEEMSDPDFWNEVAAKKSHQLFMDAYNEISKVLLPSYTYLSRLLQMCFLFIGLFPRNQEVSRSKLINLWMADGFFELSTNINSSSDAIDCLEELVSNNVVMVYKNSTLTYSHAVKTCGLHSSLWYLSRQKDRETKFAFIISNPYDCLEGGTEGHHRLCFNNNVLFGFKDAINTLEDICASTARSLLCFSPYHQYQVPLCFRLKLLRELDALSIRFYEFPMKVLQLVRLKYLALTSNGMVPPSISQLSSLQFLIIDRHQNIKSCRDQSYLPIEIWCLQDLKHLQVMGSDLPDPCGASLAFLSVLLNVGARSCTEAVFKGLPSLTELKIRIELAPDDDGSKPLSCFTHISCLPEVHLLKCIIVNPVVVPPVVPFSSYPSSYLTSLSLSGLGYPWKEMRGIASLPHLYVLKLKNYAFQGPEWRVEEEEFIALHSLLVEDTDVVDWKFECGAFKALMSLKMKSCYKVKRIHGEFEHFLHKVELVDCSPSCFEEMKKATEKEALVLNHGL